MIWLTVIGGAGPISSTGKAIDMTTIAGTEWSEYKGPNGKMMVYEVVASKQVENFEGDLMVFYNYLTKSQSFKTCQYLIKVECGPEPFVGTDVSMTVFKYSATVNTGSGGSTTHTQSGAVVPLVLRLRLLLQPSTLVLPASKLPSFHSEQTPGTSSTGSSTEETPTTAQLSRPLLLCIY